MNISERVDRLGVLTPPLPWDKSRVYGGSGDEVVVVLHGLWRSLRAMHPMSKYLNGEGFTVLNVSYASFRYDLDTLVGFVLGEIQSWVDEGKTIHFVSHSLGGVVVRRLLEVLGQGEIKKIGRVVMLAPPHGGSEIVDWLRSSPLRGLKCVLGPAGEFLSSAQMSERSGGFTEGVEAAVIMGERSAIPFFRSLLDASNDGILSVDKGRLMGVKEFKVVNADHTFISSDARVMKMTKAFILDGSMQNEVVSD